MNLAKLAKYACKSYMFVSSLVVNFLCLKVNLPHPHTHTHSCRPDDLVKVPFLNT